jgi:hypothetical protein
MDIFVAKYSSSGAHVWSRKYGAAGNEFGAGVAAENGDVTMTGFFSATLDFGSGADAHDSCLAGIGP